MKAGNGICTNPNVLFEKCLKQVALADRCAVAALRNRESVRRSLFRAAVVYQQLVKEHHEWFLAQARSVGGIDALLEGMLRDVAEGVTERQYLVSSAGSFRRRRRLMTLADRAADESPLPAAPEPSLPAGKRAAALQDQNSLLRSQLKASRAEAMELRRIAARQEKRIVELETTMNRIQKAALRLKTAS